MQTLCSLTVSDQGAALALLYRGVASLKPRTTNARTHSKHQIRQIARSIETFGFTNPVLLDEQNGIVAGHGRVEAAKLLGMSQVPTIRLSNLSQDQIRAYVLADNKLAENAGWDRSILAIELQYLTSIDSAAFDVTVTGFEVAEIDVLLEEASPTTPDEEDLEPAIPSIATTRSGDLWQLGPYLVFCGDSLRTESYGALMGKDRAAVIFSDPPFNVKIDGHATGNGRVKHREFAMASGEMSEAEFRDFLSKALRQLSDWSAQGSVHFLCMDWRHVGDLLAVGEAVYDELLNLCVWVKDNGGMGSFYRSQHELVLVFRKGRESHRNNVQLGRFGRYRTNVWQYPGIQTMSKRGDEGYLLALHPTVKPVALVADAILDCSAAVRSCLMPSSARERR